MAQHNSRNGDSGAVHSRQALQQRQQQARRQDANASAHPNTVTLREIQQRQR